ncbi:hypothetical protein KY289_008126 [Solanum tuberosum]|nr:hypothetical protein KY289_008126 [Solanum tuberosum]
MIIDELVGNLKTYEMNVESTKISEGSKEKNLACKVTDENDESDLDEEDIALISRNFNKFLKKVINFGKKSTPTKKKNIEKGKIGGCYKCGKTDHQIEDCSMWEVEWKRERAEIILPRKQKGMEVQINLPQLILSHIHRICVQDNKDHGLGSVKEWQVQTTTNVLGKVDHAAIPATSRGENSPMECLRTSLTTKGEEIAAFKVPHSTAMD